MQAGFIDEDRNNVHTLRQAFKDVVDGNPILLRLVVQLVRMLHSFCVFIFLLNGIHAFMHA